MAMLLIASMGSCKKESMEQPNLPSELAVEKSLSVNVAPVPLGIAGDFAILSKTGITNVFRSDITGDVGTSPITGAAIL